MQRPRRWRAVALAAFCLAVCPALRPGDGLQATGTVPGPTIEPALPVAVDLQFLSITEGRGGGTARLQVVVKPATAIPELSLDLLLPAGVRVQDGTPVRGLSAALEAGEPKRYEAPLVADHAGLFPVRAEVTFRLADGRTFRAGQGATLRLGVPEAQGRQTADAYEVRGVPLEELSR